MSADLINRLRRASGALADWRTHTVRSHHLDDWSILMDEAADAIEALEEEDDETA
jgi:hypothetical protein